MEQSHAGISSVYTFLFNGENLVLNLVFLSVIRKMMTNDWLTRQIYCLLQTLTKWRENSVCYFLHEADFALRENLSAFRCFYGWQGAQLTLMKWHKGLSHGKVLLFSFCPSHWGVYEPGSAIRISLCLRCTRCWKLWLCTEAGPCRVPDTLYSSVHVFFVHPLLFIRQYCKQNTQSNKSFLKA